MSAPTQAADNVPGVRFYGAAASRSERFAGFIATYSGVFTLLPMLTGRGRVHHGDILREAAKLAEAGKLKPLLSRERFTFETALQCSPCC